jgi:putative transposase
VIPSSPPRFGEVFKTEGLRIITMMPQTPRMNAVCERVIGTLRRELTETQPTRDAVELTDLRPIRRRPVVTGLINEYHHAA